MQCPQRIEGGIRSPETGVNELLLWKNMEVTDMEFSSLSKEELLAFVSRLTLGNEQKDEKIQKLEAEKREHNVRFEEAISNYERKMEVNRKIIADRFTPRSEKMPKKAEAYHKPMKCKTPTERFIEELKELQSRVDFYDFDFESNGVDRNKGRELGCDETFKIEMNPMNSGYFCASV